MVEEKKYEVVGYPIKLLLEESLEWKRNAMMDNFAQILQRIPTEKTYSSSSHFKGTAPFKVQVNINIPIFEGQIDANVVGK